MSSIVKATSKVTQALKGMSLNQTMIRIKDPKKSIPFYQKHFDMSLIEEKHFGDFSLYFLVTLPNGHVSPTPETTEAANYLSSGVYGCVLELTHNHGTENDDSFCYHNGNTTPLGFGNLGFLVDNVEAFSNTLKSDGIPQQTIGKDKIQLQDPDGYIVQVQQRGPAATIQGRGSFHHTMLRVKNLDTSLHYYRDVLGMCVVDQLSDVDGTSAFLSTLSDETKNDVPAPGTSEAHDMLRSFDGTLLELRYLNSTTDTTMYHNGNSDPRGFGHLALMVNDVYDVSDALIDAGALFQKKPDEGRMKGLAFVLDPDGYWIELISRKASIPDSK